MTVSGTLHADEGRPRQARPASVTELSRHRNGLPSPPLLLFSLPPGSTSATSACGTCRLTELNTAADPRLLLNNYFERTPIGTVLYLDENANSLLDAGSINALTDVTSSGNIEGTGGANFTNPLAFHLLATSVCRNAGTDGGGHRRG